MRRPLSLRLRVALFTSAMLFGMSIALVLFINIVATVTAPSTQSAGLPFTMMPDPEPGKGQPTGTPVPWSNPDIPSYSSPETEQIRHRVLGQLQTISLLGLLGVVVIGTLGAYWAAGRALRPLTGISRAAQTIAPDTESARLAIVSPDKEIAEVGAALDAMLNRFRHALAYQGQFVSNAAHELRTPLTVLRANVEVTQTDPKATLEDYRQMSVALERALVSLERLLADLLLMSTQESGLAREIVDLERLVRDITTDLECLAREQGLKMSCVTGVSVSVVGDGSLLGRVFGNLVENAIKYNCPGGTVTVRLARDGEWAKVTVEDTGIGIPTEHQPHIFDRFYRVDQPRSKRVAGTGLGLSIAAHVAQLHGGRIDVKSTDGAGSKFTVSLPLAPD